MSQLSEKAEEIFAYLVSQGIPAKSMAITSPNHYPAMVWSHDRIYPSFACIISEGPKFQVNVRLNAHETNAYSNLDQGLAKILELRRPPNQVTIE